MESFERWLLSYPKARYSIKLVTRETETYRIYIHGFKTLDRAKEVCDNLNNKKGRDVFLIRYETEEMR